MSLSKKALFETIRTKASAITSGAYVPLQTTTSPAIAPLLHPARILHIQNLTEQPMFFSISQTGSVPLVDGSADHIILNSQTFILLDVCSDSALPQGEFYVPQGSIIYVRAQSASSSTGAVWLTSIYGQEPSTGI